MHGPSFKGNSQASEFFGGAPLFARLDQKTKPKQNADACGLPLNDPAEPEPRNGWHVPELAKGVVCRRHALRKLKDVPPKMRARQQAFET